MKKISLAVLGMFIGISNANAQMTWNEGAALTAPFACVGNDCTLATGSIYRGQRLKSWQMALGQQETKQP